MSRWLGGRGWCAASGRSFALTRQGVRLLHRFVNCGPAQCCVPPVVAPAEGIVRAGAGRRGGAFLLECSALGSRPPCGSNRGVLRSVHACRAVLLECSALDHACRAVLLECSALDHACRAVLSECPAFDYACLAVLSRCPVFDHACCLPHSAKQDGLRFCRTFCLRSRRGLRFWRGGLPSFTPGLAVLLRCFAFGSRLSFFLCQEKRDGLRYLAFLFRPGGIAAGDDAVAQGTVGQPDAGINGLIFAHDPNSPLRYFLWAFRERIRPLIDMMTKVAR